MTSSRPRVLLVQPLLAHYRQGVVEALLNSSNIVYHVAAGQSSTDGDIATFTLSRQDHFTALCNFELGSFLWQRGLLRLILTGGFDAVIMTGSANHLTAWAIGLASRMRATPLLFWTTGWHRREKGFKRIVRLLFYRLASALMLYSDRGQQIGVDMGYPQSRMSVIYNSVAAPGVAEELEPLARTSAHGGDSTPDTKIVFVGRLNQEKRLDMLIEACDRLFSIGHHIRLVIGGDGPERVRLQHLASRSRVRVVFVGEVYSDSVLARIYQGASMTVIPGRAGLTAIQSLAYSTPVITHSNFDQQVAEASAIRPSITGQFFQQGDVRDLVQKMLLLLERDDLEARTMREACYREWLGKWSPQAHALRIEAAVLQQIADRASGAK